jgi:hypothetical protein
MNMFGFSIYERLEKGDLQKPFLPTKDLRAKLKYKSPKETFNIIWKVFSPDVIEKNSKERTGFYNSYIKNIS